MNSNRRTVLKAIFLLSLNPLALFKFNNSLTAQDTPAQIKSKLDSLLKTVPAPIIPSRPDLIAMYQKCWEIGMNKTEKGTIENGFVEQYVDAAFDRRIFQWDTCFSVAWAKYSQGALPSIVSLDNFYRKQHADGAIAGVIRKSDGADDQGTETSWFTRNNLFSWMEYEYYCHTGDSSRITSILPILKKYSNWVKQNRRHTNGHYWWSGWGSGMDNSPRSIADKPYPPHSWIDYDAIEAMSAYYIVKLARVVGDQEIEKEFQDLYEELEQLINSSMWCEEDGIYWDLDKDDSFLKVKTVASFWPLWARITNENQVDKLVSHLNDTSSFNRPHRVPTLAADDPKYVDTGHYWLGSIWSPTNHMIVKGLNANNRHQLSREIVCNHLDNMSAVFKETGTVWENYAPEAAEKGNLARPDFVGWSAVGPITELIENYIGITLDVPANTVYWNLLSTEKLGVRNLLFGNAPIELFCNQRESLDDRIEITTQTSKSFILIINNGEKTVTKKIKAGKHKFRL
ncbi:MAG: trehalase family glycosidase [Bacteroidota bacterium]|nr:trehalase family glycosidase [Bacteroidota bacterium]